MNVCLDGKFFRVYEKVKGDEINEEGKNERCMKMTYELDMKINFVLNIQSPYFG